MIDKILLIKADNKAVIYYADNSEPVVVEGGLRDIQVVILEFLRESQSTEEAA